MRIDKTSQTNFQGGFRLMNLSPEVKNEVPNILKKHRQIFDNFERQNDVFITVRDEANYKVAKFIKEHKIDFEFYPTINTQSGLDNERPWELTNLIAITNYSPIKTLNQYRKFEAKVKRENYIENNSPIYINNILKALCIDNKHQITNKKGAMVITDSEYGRDIIISPPSKLNIHYVKVVPKSVDKIVERYAIDSDGNILSRYQSPDGIMKFNKNFNALLVK